MKGTAMFTIKRAVTHGDEEFSTVMHIRQQRHVTTTCRICRFQEFGLLPIQPYTDPTVGEQLWTEVLARMDAEEKVKVMTDAFNLAIAGVPAGEASDAYMAALLIKWEDRQ